MYLDEQGNPVKYASINGPLAAGIPGIPAALDHLASHYGKLPLSTSLAPAMRFAKQGVEVDQGYIAKMKWRLAPMQQSPAASAIFLDKNELPQPGWQLRQTDLANTLSEISTKGSAGFYEGNVARLLVDGVVKHGGIWTLDDLKSYTVIERQPIRFNYRDITVISAAPPSSGGIALATILNILEGYDLQKASLETRIHLVTEAMRRAYRDRAKYLGDPDFTDIPSEQLTHPFYAAGLRASIRNDRATPSNTLPGAFLEQTGEDTTHFSIIDEEGNRVAATLSVNLPFGAAFVPEGAGVLLNNEMDDFSIKPGTPNAYGLIGAQANAIEPEKRPLSSMSPTFLLSPDRIGILGTPGGSRIITMVLHGILAFAEDAPVQQWVSLPRYHHQFLPDHIQYEENAFSPEIQNALTALGHPLKAVGRRYGDMQAILWNTTTNQVTAASDPRGSGAISILDSKNH
jgi:gamma-glutamyltranspeptidase/glutathione hydrolase